MSTERQAGTGRPTSPLTRADVELLRSRVEHSAQLDLSFQNLKQVDLSYFDLKGTNLRGADLQGANLRGAKLREAHLQGANLSDADLDGADLSCAYLSDNETNRVNLHHAKLSYATLHGLDLREFDLTELDLRNADLNGTDLRNARLRGTDLRGADLSTAQLHGPELQGAKLHRDNPGSQVRQRQRGTPLQKKPAWERSMLTQERSSPVQEYSSQQTSGERQNLPGADQFPGADQRGIHSARTLSDREAYVLGEQALLGGSDPVKVRRLFPQGFNFVTAHQLFQAWLAQSANSYNEQEIQAMWIGFAHRICDLYHEDEL